MRNSTTLLYILSYHFPSLMTAFLTVKEAAQLTGKSASSIRRIIYPIIEDDKHPDRAQIQPSVPDVLKLRTNGDNFAWRINEDFLRGTIRVDAPTGQHAQASVGKPGAHPDGPLIAMLQRELDIKNQQITRQAELLAGQLELVSTLSERIREGNILIGSLQTRLALTDGRENTATVITDPKPETPPKRERGSGAAPKAKPKKKNFFLNLFN